jgi:tripartite-type tricarboxylate transporter receptor subunit TctC
VLNRRQTIANAVIATLAGLGYSRSALAQIVQKTSRVVVGFPAGGTMDVLARVCTEKLRGAYASAQFARTG